MPIILIFGVSLCTRVFHTRVMRVKTPSVALSNK